MPSLKSRIGHLAREVKLHAERLSKPKRELRIVICVDDLNNGMSSGLRGYNLATGLEALGWRSVVIPKQLELAQRQRIIRAESPTILYLQQTRHPLNKPSLYPSQKCVIDIDDADFLDERVSENVTRCVKESFGVIAGSEFIRAFASKLTPRCEVSWTGAPAMAPAAISIAKQQPPVIVWACSNPFGYRHEAGLVLGLLERIGGTLPFEFWLIGTDDQAGIERFLAPIRAKGVKCEAWGLLPYPVLLEKLAHADIGLAPLLPDLHPFSGGKSFGKVLAYLNAGLAVVASDAADHALFFRNGVNGFIATDMESWIAAIERLLSDPIYRAEVARNGRADFERHLSTEAMTARIDQALRKWLAAERPA